MFKIKLDKEKCIGCGSCVAVCPGNFVMENGKAKAIKEEIENLGCNKMAEEVCPVSAIEVQAIKEAK